MFRLKKKHQALEGHGVALSSRSGSGGGVRSKSRAKSRAKSRGRAAAATSTSNKPAPPSGGRREADGRAVSSSGGHHGDRDRPKNARTTTGSGNAPSAPADARVRSRSKGRSSHRSSSDRPLPNNVRINDRRMHSNSGGKSVSANDGARRYRSDGELLPSVAPNQGQSQTRPFQARSFTSGHHITGGSASRTQQQPRGERTSSHRHVHNREHIRPSKPHASIHRPPVAAHVAAGAKTRIRSHSYSDVMDDLLEGREMDIHYGRLASPPPPLSPDSHHHSSTSINVHKQQLDSATASVTVSTSTDRSRSDHGSHKSFMGHSSGRCRKTSTSTSTAGRGRTTTNTGSKGPDANVSDLTMPSITTTDHAVVRSSRRQQAAVREVEAQPDASRSPPSALTSFGKSNHRPHPPQESSMDDSLSMEQLVDHSAPMRAADGTTGTIVALKNHSGPSGNTTHRGRLTRRRSLSQDDDADALLNRSDQSLGRSRSRSSERREKAEQRQAEREERMQQRASQRSMSSHVNRERSEQLHHLQQRKTELSDAVRKAYEKFNTSGILSSSSGCDYPPENDLHHDEEESKREIESYGHASMDDGSPEQVSSGSTLVAFNTTDAPRPRMEEKQPSVEKKAWAKAYLSGEDSSDDEREWNIDTERRARDDFRSSGKPTTRSRSVDDLPSFRQSDSRSARRPRGKKSRIRSSSDDRFAEEASEAAKEVIDDFLDSYVRGWVDCDSDKDRQGRPSAPVSSRGGQARRRNFIQQEQHSHATTGFDDDDEGASVSHLQDRLLELAVGQQRKVRSKSVDMASPSRARRSQYIEQERNSREISADLEDPSNIDRSNRKDSQKIDKDGFFIAPSSSKSEKRRCAVRHPVVTIDEGANFGLHDSGSRRNTYHSSASTTEGALDGSLHFEGERMLEKGFCESNHRVVLEDPFALLAPDKGATFEQFKTAAGWVGRNYDGGRAA